jgi:hypothetical protein
MNRKQQTKGGRWAMAACGLAAAVFALPGQAKAGGNWSFDVHIGPRGPMYELRTRTVWVPPVYEERVVDVKIPAVVRTREVPIYDARGRIVGFKEVTEVVEPARIERHVERVLVREGYHKRITEKVRVSPRCTKELCDRAPFNPNPRKRAVVVDVTRHKDNDCRHVRHPRRGPNRERVVHNRIRPLVHKARR